MLRRLSTLTLALALIVPLVRADEFSEEVSVSYVMVPFTVLGSRGVPITDLSSKEVSLLVDGQKVRTDLFELSTNAPVSWTILLDGSGSMGLAGKMEAAKTAINELVARRREQDDFALYLFDSQGLKDLVPFTDNPGAIARALDVVKPWGKTAFFDAVAELPARAELGRNPSRAIILLSDGIDNASKLTRAEVAKKLEAVSIPIYAFGLREPGEMPKTSAISEEMTDLDLLNELASATGGKLFVGNRSATIGPAIDGIARNLRAQYLIGFSPTGKGAVKYRRISLQLAGRVRSVRVRAGYRGTEPPVLSAATRGKASTKGKRIK
jgi:Ca-activated chloride channel family protein